MDAEFDWLTLDADEEALWSETPHPYSLVPAIVVGVLLAVVLVGIAILLGAYLSHRNTNYVVTTEALYKKTGVLSRNVQRIEFEKVQDTSYRQSFLGARYGYGTVDVSTAGGGGIEMSFASVAEPQEVQSLINERLRAGRGRSDATERNVDDVLDDVLAELRAIRTAVEAERGNSGDVHSYPDSPDPGSTDRRDLTGRLTGEAPVPDDTDDDASSEPDADLSTADPMDGTSTAVDDEAIATDDGAVSKDQETTSERGADEFRFED